MDRSSEETIKTNLWFVNKESYGVRSHLRWVDLGNSEPPAYAPLSLLLSVSVTSHNNNYVYAKLLHFTYSCLQHSLLRWTTDLDCT